MSHSAFYICKHTARNDRFSLCRLESEFQVRAVSYHPTGKTDMIASTRSSITLPVSPVCAHWRARHSFDCWFAGTSGITISCPMVIVFRYRRLVQLSHRVRTEKLFNPTPRASSGSSPQPHSLPSARCSPLPFTLLSSPSSPLQSPSLPPPA